LPADRGLAGTRQAVGDEQAHPAACCRRAQPPAAEPVLPVRLLRTME
jgi:hypothetical protein